jgi:hypothetical protein
MATGRGNPPGSLFGLEPCASSAATSVARRSGAADAVYTAADRAPKIRGSNLSGALGEGT